MPILFHGKADCKAIIDAVAINSVGGPVPVMAYKGVDTLVARLIYKAVQHAAGPIQDAKLRCL
jgi:hypothetical protein